MKKFITLLSLLLVGLFLVNSQSAVAQKKMKKEAILWPAADIKWEEMKGGPPGIMYANLWGDITKGAYGTLIKLPAGLDNPLHTHSSDVKGVVISGTFWIAPDGGEKKMFGPGSYFMVPGGWKHTSGTNGETMLFQEGPGKFDMKPMEMKKDEMMKK